MHDERLHRLLQDEAMRSLVNSECVVSDIEMTMGDPEAIVHRVRASLVRTAADHAAKHKLLDAPDALEMIKGYGMDQHVTRFRARLYLMTPRELEALLKRAYDLGRRAL